jgi:hypothetical protein
VTLYGSVLFHANLQYSSIEASERKRVIERCYRPLLALLDRVPGLFLTLEASAATLEVLAELNPELLARLRSECAAGRVEFVGSGDTQLIGPLVPAAVHRANQLLGQEAYERLLGLRPRTALVNEMAWSQGIVPGYLDAGYETLIMEWNNPRLGHPEWENEWRYGLSWTPAGDGRRARLAWVDATAFQKFQRAVTRDIELDEAADWFVGHAPAGGAAPRHLFLYASDAEVFGYRPGRYAAEAPVAPGEWVRAEELLCELARRDVVFTTPGRLAAEPAFRERGEVRLGSARDPIPVKKQPKYNVTRWALSGRDDLGLNSRCHAEAARLENVGAGADEWRALCRSWSSDLRTHVGEGRFREALERLPALMPRATPRRQRAAPLARAEARRAGRNLILETDGLRLVLNTRRGLAFDSLAFLGLGSEPLLGTLSQGTFDDIRFAADFYSGHSVLDIPGQKRITDLVAVEPEVHVGPDAIEVRASVSTPLGTLTKRVLAGPDWVRLELDLSELGERPLASLRVAHVTLWPAERGGLGSELAFSAAQGGAPERFLCAGAFDHGRAVPPLVTASAACAPTDGRLTLDDGERALELSFDPAQAAALALVSQEELGDGRLARVAFSLAEVDDTFRAGAQFPDFALEIRARRISA